MTVAWDGGELSGDADFVAFLLGQEACGEPIGLDSEGRVVEVSFATQELALDSLLATTGNLAALDGDLDATDAAYYLHGDDSA